jgi:DNA (cytosine-5)-methyltransferase 1
MKKRHPLKLIDLFCGAGGLTLGFKQVFGRNLEPVWANDFDEAAAMSYAANFGKCTTDDIVELLKKKRAPKADLVIGGPPCQGFSLLNKNKEADPRKQMWRPFIEVVLQSGAEVFVMENVPQLKDSPEHAAIIREAEETGFETATEILRASDYGVPQRRYRCFIIGCTFADPKSVFPPPKTHYNPNNGVVRSLFKTNGDYIEDAQPWRTVRDAIEDLPDPIGTEIRDVEPPLNLQFGRTPTMMSMKRYRAIPKEGMNRFDLEKRAPHLTPECWIRKKTGGTDLFGRLWWDRPAFTIRTEFFKPEKGRYLHPVKHRPITHREAARLQSFPDSFRFCGTKIEIARQIGNAVPPALAASVATCVRELFRIREKNVSGR